MHPLMKLSKNFLEIFENFLTLLSLCEALVLGIRSRQRTQQSLDGNTCPKCGVHLRLKSNLKRHVSLKKFPFGIISFFIKRTKCFSLIYCLKQFLNLIDSLVSLWRVSMLCCYLLFCYVFYSLLSYTFFKSFLYVQIKACDKVEEKKGIYYLRCDNCSFRTMSRR